MISVRKATAADIPVIRELTFKIWPQTYVSILSTEQIAYMLDMMYSVDSLNQQFANGHSFIVCYKDKMPIGFASWSETEAGVFKLHKIYVLPEQQGVGAGKYMIEHILSELRKQSAIYLDLNVNRYNKAKNFYEKLGFKAIKEEDINIGGGYFMNDFVMRFEL